MASLAGPSQAPLPIARRTRIHTGNGRVNAPVLEVVPQARRSALRLQIMNPALHAVLTAAGYIARLVTDDHDNGGCVLGTTGQTPTDHRDPACCWLTTPMRAILPVWTKIRENAGALTRMRLLLR